MHILEILLAQPDFRYFQTVERFPKQHRPLLTTPLPDTFLPRFLLYKHSVGVYSVITTTPSRTSSFSLVPFPPHLFFPSLRPPLLPQISHYHPDIPYYQLCRTETVRCVLPSSVRPSNICFSHTPTLKLILLSGNLYPSLQLDYFILHWEILSQILSCLPTPFKSTRAPVLFSIFLSELRPLEKRPSILLQAFVPTVIAFWRTPYRANHDSPCTKPIDICKRSFLGIPPA